MTKQDNSLNHSNLFLIKRIYSEYMKKYNALFFIAMFFMIIVAVTTALNAWIIKPVLDNIFQDNNVSMLYLLAIALMILSIVKAISSYIERVIMRTVENNIILDMQYSLYTHLLYSDLALLSQYSSGKLISHFSNDIQLIRKSITSVLTNIIRDFVTVIALLTVLFLNVPLYGIIFILIIPIIIVPLILLGRKIRKISNKTQNLLGNFTVQLDETFKGIKIIKAYQGEKIEKLTTYNITNKLKKINFKFTKIQEISSPLMELLLGAGMALFLILMGKLVIVGTLTVGTFFMLFTVIISAYKPIKALGRLNAIINEGLTAANRIFIIMDKKPVVIEKKDAVNLNISDKFSIKYNNVCFQYKKNPVLNNVNFSIESGQKVALVGRSGSGKSTIINLLLRYYDPTSGDITINSENIKNIKLSALRTSISFVSQDNILFDGSIIDNIGYGYKEIDRNKAILAAKSAYAHEFIVNLDGKYDAYIGQSGSQLSGGEKQRITIARAIYREAPILILDEATSSLDSDSEKKIQEALYSLMKSKTAFIITHKLSTIQHADKIIVIDNGVIIEQGTHKELLKKENSVYKKLYNTFQ